MAHKHDKDHHAPDSDEEHQLDTETDHKPAEAEEAEEPSSQEEPEEQVNHEHQAETKTGSKLQQLWQWSLSHKQVSVPIAVLLLLGLIMAVPLTRYKVLGLFLKQEVTVMVLDSQTSLPVSSATVELNGKTVEASAEGLAKFTVPVGEAKVSVAKEYYRSASREILVPVKKPTRPFLVELEATGRLVPVAVVNSINGQPVAGATISAEKSQAKTDDKGQTILVVPTSKTAFKGTLAANGYNTTTITVKVTTGVDKANSFKLTPAGKIYVLSNQSGKIDLVKSNLDGTDRKVVLPGTGKEGSYGTTLIASRDWKYVALLSKRDGGKYPKIFVVETSTDKIVTADEGEATFGIYGWSGDRLVYRVTRQKLDYWQPKRQALKSYQASTKKLTTLDQTSAQGPSYSYNNEYYSTILVLDNEVVYAKNWANNLYDKSATLNSIKPDGSQKKTIKSVPSSDFSLRTAEFGEIYIQYPTGDAGNTTYHHAEYKDGKLTAIELDETEFHEKTYPSYYVSPSGKRTLWSDYRDGKNVFFVGDANGENGKQVGAGEEFNAYGWFTDSYILLTKKGSEMRIMSADRPESDLETILRVGSYYTPGYYQSGFGYGYGG